MSTEKASKSVSAKNDAPGKSKNSSRILKTILAGMFLGIALALPFLTGQIPEVGQMLLPMHLPVMICGFICGPFYALVVGLIAPVLRFILFNNPPLVPKGIPMCFELATYGFVAGLLYRSLPKKKLYIWVSLVISMLAGRIVWAAAKMVLLGLGKAPFSFTIFITDGFVEAAPGIIAQLILVPLIVMAIKKADTSHRLG